MFGNPNETRSSRNNGARAAVQRSTPVGCGMLVQRWRAWNGAPVDGEREEGGRGQVQRRRAHRAAGRLEKAHLGGAMGG